MYAIKYDVSCTEKNILPMLNLPIEIFTLSGFNTKLNYLSLIDPKLDTNHL